MRSQSNGPITSSCSPSFEDSHYSVVYFSPYLDKEIEEFFSGYEDMNGLISDLETLGIEFKVNKL